MKEVPDKFVKVADFISLKKNCIFCQTPLRTSLTNFIGIKKDGLPVLNVPLEDRLFKFQLKHTTAEFSIKADITMQPSTNIVIFDNFTNGDLPSVDSYLIKKVFEEYSPTVELCCVSRGCRTKYYLTTDPLKMIKVTGVTRAWQILPTKVFLESFRLKSLNVLNDWHTRETQIYSIKNEDAKPLRMPLMDFESMPKERLFTRLQTLVTFS